ncbi:hypothetical protein [Fictibacillus phosphorivorans]|uniref:hypothetical protein n=1 Tax=Fictibacillus phosphorivorans TaxID=1221500 RepID=UPI0012933B39|nr:hypothetical protein [Fictibacillus phosphorivorans]MQR93620.1 hypothetical protein [Fictibacillus phosphorivorans]
MGIELTVVNWFNIGAFAFGLILAITSFVHYKKLGRTRTGVYWAIGCIATCLLFINGIIKIVDIMDEHTKKQAFETLEETYHERGDHNNESFKNLEVVVIPEKGRGSAAYKIYAANFNKQYTYKGEIKITVKNRQEKKVFTHVTETVTLKPGEKKELKNTLYDTTHYNYSWRWLGKLKK